LLLQKLQKREKNENFGIIAIEGHRFLLGILRSCHSSICTGDYQSHQQDNDDYDPHIYSFHLIPAPQPTIVKSIKKINKIK